MADREIRVTLDGDKIQSLKIIDLKATPGPSAGEKVLYFIIGIPLLLYFIVHYW